MKEVYNMDVQYRRCSAKKCRFAPQSFTLVNMVDGCTLYGDLMLTKSKFSRTDGLPYFFTHGALRKCLWCAELRYKIQL